MDMVLALVILSVLLFPVSVTGSKSGSPGIAGKVISI